MEGFFPDEQDWSKHWRSMPEFSQKDLTPHQSLQVHFRNPEDRQAFAELIGRSLTSNTRSVWYPREIIGRYADKSFVTETPVNPKYPVYIVSKGRWETRLTAKSLEAMGVPFFIVVEEQEYEQYCNVIDRARVLILDKEYQRDYDPCDDLGDTKSKGPGPARNFAWEHSIKSGAVWHWVMDDNINGFYRLANNLKTPAATGAIFRAMEDFVNRYTNVTMAGPNYFMFASRKSVVPPFVCNTRIYSCNLIRNDAPFRWRGRYNEDTDISLRMLKAGLCTVQFNAFLQYKLTNQTLTGGCTGEFYAKEGTLPKSEIQVAMHPDVSRLVKKFGRWHHEVDYTGFKRNKLEPRRQLDISPDANNYGMYLTRRDSRVLLIGQAPGQDGGPDRPLEGLIGRRLASLAGLSETSYLDRTDRCNMFDQWPGKNGKGDAWDAKAALQRVDEMLPNLAARRVIFLGRNVATAFGQGDLQPLTWREVPALQATVAAVPHPSGIVTWWNDPGNKAAAAEFLRETFAAK